jgi:hypothetical protein
MIGAAFLLLLLIFLVLGRIHRNKSISALLALSLTIYVIFWNAFPFLYSVFARERTGNIIDWPAYQKGILVQFISVLVILLSLDISTRIRSRRPRPLPRPYRKSFPKIILIVLVGSFILDVVAQIFSIKAMGSTFSERVAFTVSDRNVTSSVGALLTYPLSYIMSFALACLFSGIRALRKNRWIVRAAVAIIFSHIGFMILYGIRSFIFLPIILVVFYDKAHPGKWGRKTKLLAVAVLAIMIFLAPFLSMTLQAVRNLPSYGLKDFLTRAKELRVPPIAEYGLNALDDVYTKFSSLINGAVLLDWEGTSRAGFSLITSALVSPVPRMFYPGKPVPFSSNGEYSGIPYYVVPAYEGGLPGMVVPVSPSAIALWELGYLGLVVLLAANLLNLALINYFLRSDSLLYNTAGFLLLAMPTFEFLIAPAGYLIKEGLRIAIVLMLVKSILSLGRSMRPDLRLTRSPRTGSPISSESFR